MKVLRTGIFSKLDKENKINVPLAIRAKLGVKEGDRIEFCLNRCNGKIVLKKFEKEKSM